MSAMVALVAVAVASAQPEPAVATADVVLAPAAPEAVSPTSTSPEVPDVPAKPDPPSDTAPEEIIVSGQSIPGDPLAEVNAASYEVVQAADRAIIRPAAMAYRAVVPKPGRDGVRNFLSNLAEPVVFINFVLQLKIGKAAETAGRFAINSTIGAAGLVDVAKRKPFRLPRRPNGFANTLGYYGVKPGAYLFLPIVGPTTLRDLIGLGIDRLVVPLAAGKPFDRPYYAIPAGVLSSLDQRAEGDERLARLHDETANAYAATREAYLSIRQAEIDGLRAHKADQVIPD